MSLSYPPFTHTGSKGVRNRVLLQTCQQSARPGQNQTPQPTHDDPERVRRPLSRIAELLVENNAEVSLNEIRDLLEALDARPTVKTCGLSKAGPTTVRPLPNWVQGLLGSAASWFE